MIIVPELKAEHGSIEIVKEIAEWLWARYTYKADEGEDWGNTLSQLKRMGALKNDCDGWSRTLMSLCFLWGRWKLSNMAEVVVDTNLKDDKPFDHHVAGFWNGRRWKYSHCWLPRLVDGYLDRNGEYVIETGISRTSMKPESHRLLSAGTWIEGRPIHDTEV